MDVHGASVATVVGQRAQVQNVLVKVVARKLLLPLQPPQQAALETPHAPC